MAYRPHGRAKVNPNSPRAFARCDRCGFIYNHINLKFQYDFRGPQLQNLRFLVCNTCYDKPQPQLKPIILTEDPLPILNARPEDYINAEVDYIATVEPTTTYAQTGIPVPQGSNLTTLEGQNLIVQPVGHKLGLNPGAVMPLQGTAHFNIPIPALSVSTTGNNIVTVTCSSPHGLSNNSQISIFGTSIPQIQGFFSVTVVSATVFSYAIVPFVSTGSYLTPTTRIATASVGLPYTLVQIPIVSDGSLVGVAATPYVWLSNNGQGIYFTNNDGNILSWSFGS
jgi:hypothetical protein